MVRELVSNVVVLLTATIDPRNMAMVARRDPVQRLNDYKNALRICWLSKQCVSDVVFCENSRFDLSEIRELFAGATVSGRRTEIMSFEGLEYSPHLGKGYGEIGIISHALRHSELLQVGNPLIVKVSGRLAVGNIRRLLRMVQASPNFDVSCDLRGNLQWADSRVFVARASFLSAYLIPLQAVVNDSRGSTFEHALGQAVHRAVGDGLRWVPMVCTPRIQGIQATSDVKYPDSWIKWLARDTFRRLKNWMLAR